MQKVALITGGTRGIGLGIAKKLAENGYDLVLNGVRPESEILSVLAELRQIGVSVCYAPGNIGLSEDRKSILQVAKENFGGISVLVNNAGVAPRTRADILNVTEEDYDHLMEINQRGTFFITQLMANWMIDLKKNNPLTPFSIVNITSISATVASTNRAVYCMSKSGLSMLSQVLAIRLSEEAIPVFEVRPGVIQTDMTEKVKGIYQEKIERGLTLEPRMGMPEDIGKVVSALVKEDLPYCTGQVITVDGGLSVARL
jgi:NAD(P)-dependent dehydrogenase (short-subunit alcohol dehydrogenase family)